MYLALDIINVAPNMNSNSKDFLTVVYFLLKEWFPLCSSYVYMIVNSMRKESILYIPQNAAILGNI